MARSNKSIHFLQEKSEEMEKGEGSYFGKNMSQFSVEMRKIDNKQVKYDMLINRPKIPMRNLNHAFDRFQSGTLDSKSTKNNLPALRRTSDQRQQLNLTSR